jgi:hypothetical protein
MMNLFGPNIVYDPVIDPGLLVLLGAASIGLSVFLYLRQRAAYGWIARTSLLVLRTAGILLLLLILARPMCEERPEGSERRSLAVLVDTSRSMNTVDVEGRTRLEAVKEQVLEDADIWEALQKDHDLRFYDFGPESKPRSLKDLLRTEKGEGESTDLGGSLINVLNTGGGEDLEGVLVLSDGRHNAGSDPEMAARQAYSRGVPVFACGVGTSKEIKDVALASRTVEDFAFVGEEAAVWASLYQRGFSGETVNVEFYRDGERVSSRQVILGEQSTYELQFPVKEEERGQHTYTVKARPLQGESNSRNNEYNVYMNFLDKSIRVLLVEGRPHWDTKFLVQTLRTDPTLTVDSIFQLTYGKAIAISTEDPSAARRPAGRFRFPETRSEIFQYDVLILGRGIDDFLTPERVDLLDDFLLERGGSIIFCRGKAYNQPNEALSRLEPVVWATGSIRDFRYKVTDAGRDTPIFEFEGMQGEPVIRELPSLISATRILGEKSLSVVLARADDGGTRTMQRGRQFIENEMAVLAYQRYGRGKVMTVASDGLWRWAFLPPRLEAYKPVYGQFWGQLIRWLISGSEFLPGQDTTFRTTRKVYAPGEVARFNILYRGPEEDFRARIEVLSPDGTAKTVIPEKSEDSAEMWTASFVPNVEGEYIATLSGPGRQTPVETRFSCHYTSLEDQLVSANHDVLKRICLTSGGEYFKLGDHERLLDVLGARTKKTELAPRRRDAWDNGLLLSVVLGIFSLEWLGRRRLGLTR